MGVTRGNWTEAPGGHIKVFDGRAEISSFFSSEGFRGVTVAVGDVDGDGDFDPDGRAEAVSGPPIGE